MNIPLLAGIAVVALLAACSNSNKAEPPAALTVFRTSADVERLWTAKLSGNKPRLRLGLGVAAAGDAVFAASYGGDIVAFDRATGRRLWRTDTKLKLTGGPGAGDGLVAAGSSHGDVVALDAATGAERWRSRVNSELLAAPAIGGNTVVIRAVDGRLLALRASDGSMLWSTEEEVPRLSLRGTAQPVIVGDLAVSGFDNGRVLAVNLANGATEWEITVAPPTGRSELERLVDIDSAVQALDNEIYVVTYQGKAASINAELGQRGWERDVSSRAGLAVDDEGVYVATADGIVVKIARRNSTTAGGQVISGGVELWRQSALRGRRLSAPAVLGPLVAVADLEGYVHFLQRDTGALAARVRPLDDQVRAAPVVSGDALVMMDVDGSIAALRVGATGDAASGEVTRGGRGGGSSAGRDDSGFDTRSKPGT